MKTYVKPMEYFKTVNAISYNCKDEPMPGVPRSGLESKLRFIDAP